jgi:hypothetical protein
MAKLLETLGLAPLRTPAGVPPVTQAASSVTPATLKMRPADGNPAKNKPIDLKLPPDYKLPDDPKQPVDFKLPADPKKQVDVLADAISTVQDVAKRDKLVRALRDAVARIQPVMSDKEAKKAIDKAIDSLVESGSKKLLLSLIEAAIGKKATTMPDDDKRTQTGPPLKEKDLGEHIIKSPEIPIGKPPAVHRNSFEFRGLPKTAKPSAYVDFKLLTPDWFDPNKTPGSWVVLMEAEDFKTNKQSAHNLHDRHIEAKGTLDMSLAMPDDPGHYVIAIKIQSDFESYPVEDIELKK